MLNFAIIGPKLNLVTRGEYGLMRGCYFSWHGTATLVTTAKRFRSEHATIH